MSDGAESAEEMGGKLHPPLETVFERFAAKERRGSVQAATMRAYACRRCG